MVHIRNEARDFRRKKELGIREGRQNAILQIVSGMDMACALGARGAARNAILVRLRRLIERERLKGVRRHWSYDLNRHIALKEAYDRLKAAGQGGADGGDSRMAAALATRRPDIPCRARRCRFRGRREGQYEPDRALTEPRHSQEG